MTNRYCIFFFLKNNEHCLRCSFKKNISLLSPLEEQAEECHTAIHNIITKLEQITTLSQHSIRPIFMLSLQFSEPSTSMLLPSRLHLHTPLCTHKKCATSHKSRRCSRRLHNLVCSYHLHSTPDRKASLFFYTP